MFHAPCLEEVGKEMGGKLGSSIRPEAVWQKWSRRAPMSLGSGILAHLYYVGPISLVVDEDEELLTAI